MFCKHCGTQVNDNAVICVSCGCSVKGEAINGNERSQKSKTTALILCIFLGGLGIHRFYVGKIGTGILMLLTLGLLGIMTLIDFINIVFGNFTDNEGKKLQ